MEPQFYWSLFLASGNPVAYLCFQRALREEEVNHVYQDAGPRAAGDGI